MVHSTTSYWKNKVSYQMTKMTRKIICRAKIYQVNGSNNLQILSRKLCHNIRKLLNQYPSYNPQHSWLGTALYVPVPCFTKSKIGYLSWPISRQRLFKTIRDLYQNKALLSVGLTKKFHWVRFTLQRVIAK